jgi:hypothetical protein
VDHLWPLEHRDQRERERQQERMKLHGTIIENLQAALASAKRLRGHPVHKDTISFWRDLIAQARSETPEEARAAETKALIVALEGEIADQQSS